jgi:GNAT superfamily N-acetyltransferase
MYAIRRAELQDVDDLVRLRVDFLNEHKPMSPEDTTVLTQACWLYFVEYLPTESFAAWVADADVGIVATGMVVYYRRPPRIGSLDGVDAFLLGMYTVPSWRRRGIGTAMLDTIVESVKATPARSIILNALDDGRAIYERAGFEPRADSMRLTW